MVRWSCVSLLVRHRDSNGIGTAARSAETDECDTDAISHMVVRSVGRDECIGGNDTANVSEANLPCCADGTTVVTSEVHVEPAYNDRHSGVGAHGDQEERRVL